MNRNARKLFAQQNVRVKFGGIQVISFLGGREFRGDKNEISFKIVYGMGGWIVGESLKDKATYKLVCWPFDLKN